MAACNAPAPAVDPVLSQINELFEHLHVCLEMRRVALIDQYQDTQNEIASRPQALARKENELIRTRTDIENNIQMNELRELQERMLAEIERKLAEVRAPQPDTRVVFRSQCVPLEQLIAELGEVVKEEAPTVPNYQALRPVVTVGKYGTALGELFTPHAVTTDSNNRIFVAEGFASVSHARISVFSERGEFLDSFTPQHMKCPFGLAIHGDNLYATDIEVHAIFQFKMKPEFSFVAKQGTQGSQIEEFNSPLNLTVSTNGDVYVADCDNNRVQILNNSLQHLRTLSEQPIQRPRDIKLTPDEVYVLCNSSPCVHVFSHAGERLRSLVSQVTDPNYFCLDAEENLIISDNSAHRIQIFTKEGNLIRTIGEEGQQPRMLYHPTGVTITKELSLFVVSSNYSSPLQIFSC